MTTDCPVCDRENGHVPGCVIGELQALGKEGRQQHRRALLLVLLHTHPRPMTLRELADAASISVFDLSETAQTLMHEGLIYPHFSNFGQSPALELTTAPHVPQECEQAADLLGMVLGQPLSPLLRRPA